MVFLEIAFYSFFVIVGIQIIFFGIVFNGINTIKPSSPNPKNIAVSVIVCAKNEAENLRQFLPLLVSQNYPNFELILINDNSTDDTLSVLEAFEAENDNIKIVNVKPIEKFWGNKKYALTLGIKAA